MPEPDTDDLLTFVARATGASGAERAERIQSLWGGYGELVRVRLRGADRSTVVVKWAKPPAGPGASDASHARKVRSYEVETAFYRTYAARCDAECRVATLLGHERRKGETRLILEDLDAAGFARRTRHPEGADLDACLSWLAHFHARFLGERPDGLWKIGTYWHLTTRQKELDVAAARDASLPARALEWDRALRSAQYQTLVHGDAKPANFCFGRAGAAIAAVDFQYVGGGPGIVDVAYLLHGESGTVTRRALDVYFVQVKNALAAGVDGGALEREWRDLLSVASFDFERFLAGWRG